MNIWIINETIGSKIHGMVYRPYYMAKEFVKKGMTVTVFSGSYTHILSKLPEVEGRCKKEMIDGVNYCWVKTPKYSRSQSLGRIRNAFTFVFKLFTINKKDFGKPDVVIITSPTPFSIINGYFYKLKYKAKLIFEVRDIWPLTLIEIGRISKGHPFVLFTQIFENFCYKVSDIVVSVLPEAKAHMTKHWMAEHKFRYIPNGIDLEEVENSQPLSGEVKALIPKDKFIVMYAGKIGQSNALEYLVDAAGILKDNEAISFVIVGEGDEKQKLKEVVQNRNLDNIHFIDQIPKNEVQSLLALADIFYIGWHRNNLYKFGVSANKLYDYLYAGKPIVHSVSAANDCVADSGCGISVDAESPEKIAEAVSALFNMSVEEREVMGKKGREYVCKNHSYEKLSGKYINIFKV